MVTELAIERPEEYVLAAEWEEVEDHQRVIDSADYPALDGAQGQYVTDASISHYKTLF
ncbi:MAG: hypothetical protein WBB69_11150 [Anaerolineales bacterium]